MTESLLDQPSTPPQVDDYLAELTKPGAKFDRSKYANEAEMVQAIARGKYEADLHIGLKNRETDTIQAELRNVKQEYNAGPKLQEVLDRILAAQNQTSSSNYTQSNEDTRTEQATFDPSKLDTLLNEKLTQIETQRKAQENWKSVKEKLEQKFGDRFPEVVATQTQKLGLTADKVDEFARTSPQAFFRLMGFEDVQTQQSFQAPPRSSSQSTFAPSGAKTKKWSDWKAELKSNPNLFSDSKAHNQMMENIKTIGEAAFYDTP